MIVEVDGKAQLVGNNAQVTIGHDPRTGNLLLMHEGRVTVVLRPFKIVEKSDADEKLPHLTQTRRHLIHSLLKASLT